MQIIQNVLSDDDFNHELISRFFNINSYFFQCVKQELSSLLNDENSPNRAEYILFGNLIDKVVSSKDKVQILDSVSKINGFEKFNEKLHEGVRCLRETELDCESMKIEIKKLAQMLTKTALQAIFISDSKTELENCLNILNEQVKENVIHESADEIDIDDFNSLFEENNTQINDSLNDECNSDSTAPSSEEPGKAEPDLFLEDLSDNSEIKEEEKEILLFENKGMDAMDEGGCELGFTEEGGSVESELIKGVNNNKVSNEPSSIIEVFKKEIKCQINLIHAAIAILNKDFKNRKQWETCDKLFEIIASEAMIFGFDAFEQIAVKARKFIASVLNEMPSYSKSVLILLSKTNNVLESFVENDVDDVDDKVIENLSRMLMEPRKAVDEIETIQLKEEVKNEELDLDQKNEDSAKEDEPILEQESNTPVAELSDTQLEDELFSQTEDESLSPLEELSFTQPQEELASQIVEPSISPLEELSFTQSEEEFIALPEEISSALNIDDLETDNHDNERSDFKLPGEDDKDILNMVAEITNENKSILSDIQESTYKIDEETNETSIDKVAKVESPISSELYNQFQEQAEFYYNIIKEALEKLKAEPFEKVALEDLELASNSLYGLAIKLNLEPLSKFPAAIEELVGNIISTKSSLSENGQQLIKKVYQKFRNFDCIEKTNSSECNKLLTLIHRLDSSIKKKANDFTQIPDDFSIPGKGLKGRLNLY